MRLTFPAVKIVLTFGTPLKWRSKKPLPFVSTHKHAFNKNCFEIFGHRQFSWKF